jgi:hypothetical protein
MTVTNFLLIGLIISVVWFSGQILDRLPKPQKHKDFAFEDYECFVHFRIDALTEKDFEVSFADDWNTGRPFMLYGPLTGDPEDRRFGGLEPKGRLGVHVYPTAQWFKQSRIGNLRAYPKGGIECHVSLPYQIARHVLEDVRREPVQIVSIGFAKTTDKDGETTYPIYSFELSEAFD